MEGPVARQHRPHAEQGSHRAAVGRAAAPAADARPGVADVAGRHHSARGRGERSDRAVPAAVAPPAADDHRVLAVVVTLQRRGFFMFRLLVAALFALPRAGPAQTFKVARFNIGGDGDSTVTMFDLASLAVIKKIHVPTGGLDGIMFDDFSGHIILTNHSRPIGTVVALDPASGAIVGTVELEDNSPEGAASDGKGRIFVNNEGKSTIQVIDDKSLKVVASWPLAPCEGPTGIAYDRAANRIFSGCGKTSVVIDPASGKVVAKIANGDGVDALGWDASQGLIYIPAGRDSNVTVVHADSPDHYSVLATVATMRGAKTITVDPVRHVAYLFQPEYGPLPPGSPPPAPGSRAPRGPVVAAWFFVISH